MYFLVYIPMATGGSGFGVFCVLVLSLVLIIGAAAAAFPWLAAPATLVYSLMQSEQLAWILPVVLIAAVAINFFIAMGYERWMPLAPGIFAAVLAVVVSLFLLIQEIARQGNLLGLILLLPIPFIALTIVFYPFTAALTAVSSLPTVFVRWRYALGALCSVISLVCFMGVFQSLVEMFIGLFGQSSLLENVMIHYELDGLLDFTFGLTDQQHDNLERSIAMIGERLAAIPAGTRCLVCALLCVAGVVGEVFCASETFEVF